MPLSGAAFAPFIDDQLVPRHDHRWIFLATFYDLNAPFPQLTPILSHTPT
jgi:hypothetical protein